MNKKPVEQAECCNECIYLINDNDILRCMMFDNALLKDTNEKHCKDSCCL